MGWVEAEREYPVPVEQLWAVLSDTSTMVDLDPLLVRFEPDGGVVTEGTENRVRARLGPWSVRLRTRTERLDPPHGATFVSVRPRYPVRVTTEELLEPTPVGCRYRIRSTASPTLPIVGHLAAVLVPRSIIRTRRQLQARLAALVDAGPLPAGEPAGDDPPTC